MKAIKVRYHAATNHLGARYIASDQDGNRLVQSAGQDHDYHTAAEGLRDKMGWSGELVGGSLAPDIFVFVFLT